MDGVVVILLAVILYFRYYPKSGMEDQGSEIIVESITENKALNPEMRHDEHAFMVIANELGFH